MLISVIVPVYNIEKYINKCIDSIIRQTYKNIELILVDDGSTDNSGKLCDKLASQDTRIKVLHKQNGGVSSARNLGIEKSTGDYICFVDGDDWLEIDYFALAVPCLKKHKPKLLQNNYVKDDGIGNITNSFNPSTGFQCDAEQALYEMVNGCHYGWEPFASFYEANACKKVKFNTEIVFGEDLLFRYEFTKANDGLYIYKYLPKYHYYTRENSAVNSYAIYRKIDDLKVFELILKQENNLMARLLYKKEYLPRLIRDFKLGIVSNDSRDVSAAMSVRRKIKNILWKSLFSNDVGLFIKCKLIICVLPIFIFNIVSKIYSKTKKNHLYGGSQKL